ncbi:outer membrane protein [Methylobacterium sp. WSM2598]|uniref:outer membrane protein n=1 Tax=Methylobacterium sp. WSM2598 TaxID=398261 RepID=UPI000371CADF|nr:hypothetical protein [Methylobacterium sp. WSM2598]
MAALAGAALACGQAARAADLAPRPVPPAPAIALDWSGFYLGAQTGGFATGQGRRTFVSGDGGGLTPTVFGGRGGRTGIVAGTVEGRTIFEGVHAGYNWQRGDLVGGVEGDLSAAGPLDDVLASLRGRVGVATGRALVYGTAGLGILSAPGGRLGVFVGGNGGNGGNAGPGGAGGAGGNGFGTLTISQPGATRLGFAGGAGLEVRLTPRVGAGVEALYFLFDKGSPGIPREALTLRGRLTYHFGAEDPAEGPGAAPAFGAAPSWAGFYLGAQFGALYSPSGTRLAAAALANGEAGGAGTRGIDGGGGGGGAVAFAALQRGASALGGLHLGANAQSARLVYGAEADIDAGTDANHRVLASLRGRLGWVLDRDLLLYGTAGLGLARDEGVRLVFAGNGGPGGNGGPLVAGPGGAGGAGGQALALRAADTQVGFVAGAGLQARLTDRLTAGVEGLYYGFRASGAALPGAGRAVAAGRDNDAVVLRTRLSFSLQP